MTEEKKGFKFPTAYTILVLLIVLVLSAPGLSPPGNMI